MARKIKFYKENMIEYEILKLVDFYDDILRQPTIPWDFSTRTPKESEFLAFSMAETLGELGGLGLSANQVGLKDRICVINMGSEIWTMFNPEIVDHGLTPSKYSEGCLSYPGLYLTLPRYDHIKVKFNAVYGQEVVKEFDGLTAVCIQHEIDHLDGIVYTDKVSSFKLDQAKRKVKKNLKRMKLVAAQQHEAAERERVISEKQKMKPIAGDSIPTLTVIDPDKLGVQEEQKFVYRTD